MRKPEPDQRGDRDECDNPTHRGGPLCVHGFERIIAGLLILLCHKLARWQQGQRGKRRAMLRASLMRMVAIDALMWRSARIGGSAGSITRG